MFPVWLRTEHLINFVLVGLLMRSGWEVVASHPRLYWRNDCGPGTEWLHFTKDKVPDEIGAFTARDDQRNISPMLTLPGRAEIGLGRAWKALLTSAWVILGVVYIVGLFSTGQWRTLVPTSWSIIPDAWHSLTSYLSGHVPPSSAFQPFDPLQQLMYFAIVFLVAPLMIVTGPIMSPAVIGRFPWYPKIFGNRQAARSIHFLGMALITVFMIVHITLVFVVRPQKNLTAMVLGSEDPARLHTAVLVAVVTIVLVVALWIALSYLTLVNRRRSQRVLYAITEPLRRMVLNPMHPRVNGRKPAYTDADISPFHWVNTRTPSQAESAEYVALAADDFKDYRLQVGGLVAEEKSFSLAELKQDFEVVHQIQMHTCMQGWTGIAKWTGVRLRDVLAIVEKKPEARYVMFTSFGLAQKNYNPDDPLRPYYTCLPLDVAMEDETILAWGMNDPDKMHPMYGPPIRLRANSIHGYKMVKWVKSIEWIADYREIQDGQGGTREDSGLQYINARI
ncbi:MAG: molybdopterin-dependent oxidoreductase [Actinomycetia bacterium]|nr:molybdopterin-dependent oxidoreductase [Actinomycetes bacterium]